MRTVKKNVYYCEHCSKKGLSMFHINKHEITCTANPDRKCGKCDSELNIRQIVDDLKKLFEIKTITVYTDEGGSYQDEVFKWTTTFVITLQSVIELAKGCPNCTLAILRQTHLNWDICGLEKFDYKKAFAEFPMVYKEPIQNYY